MPARAEFPGPSASRPSRIAVPSALNAPSGSSELPPPPPESKRYPVTPKLFSNQGQSPWSVYWSRWATPWMRGENALPKELDPNQVWAVSWASVTGEGLVLVQASEMEIAEALGKQTIALERWDGTLAVLKPDGQAERLSLVMAQGHALGASQNGDLYRILPLNDPRQ